ncbi:MAG: hypothetical protein JOY61_01055, partial [Chloroflexi bacterium]|nr:hypothetical protein [Chloroflexota bacterium]
DYAPPDQAREVLDMLSARLDDEQRQFEDVIQRLMEAFNTSVRSASMAPVGW